MTRQASQVDQADPTPSEHPGQDPVDTAWAEYLLAARQLDTVRRAAATAAGEQARSVQAAREELTQVRARLVPQQSRLRSLGVPEAELLPTAPELAATSQEVAGGPAAVLATLRRARAAAGAAEVRITGVGGLGSLGRIAVNGPVWLRNLAVYVPLAALAVLGQMVLYLVTIGSVAQIVTLPVGLLLPAAAFGTGWLVTGLLFGSGRGTPVDRTPALGALVCLVPAMLACLSAGVLNLLW
ncbi:hypothetical protein GCM10027290_35500 [Micromonospora sonneratiae]|uniref:Yip1 domain-containing protein n=1 Tax=Micromonospora sonneratiae TaxID=1184706 RepID=A0ABW3YCK5_9ACTN